MSNGETQSILVLPEQQREAHELLDELSARGLIGPVLVVSRAGTTEELVAGERQPVELKERLAELYLDRLRVVSVATCVGGRSSSVADIGGLVRSLRDDCLDAGVRFSAISLVVTDRVSTVPAEIFHADWEAGLILVPEDTAGSVGMLAVDLTPEKVPHVAVSAAATVGALWTWLDAAPFDQDPVQYVQGERHAALARLSVRLVDAGDVAAQVVNWALDPGGVWPVPPNCTSVTDPVVAAQTLADRIAAAPEVEFQFRSPSVPAPQRRQRVGIFRALALFFRRLWSHLRAMPARKLRKLRDGAIQRVEDVVQERTFGVDSRLAVSAGLVTESSGSGKLELPARDVTPKLRPLRPLPPESSPELWNVLRSAVFGSVDGSDFRGSLRGAELEASGDRAVFADRTDVVPAPAPGETLSFVATADELDEADGANETVVGAVDVSAARQLHQQIPASGNSIRDRFDEWVEERRDSLLWKLGEHLGRSVEEALETLTTSETELLSMVRELEQIDDDQQRVSKKARRRTIVLLIFFLLLLAATVVGFVFFALIVGLIATGALVVGLFVMGVAFLGVAREEVRIEFRLREYQTRPEYLDRVRAHAANELTRLTHLNDQFCDWAEVYAHILHRPWGEHPPDTDESQEPWSSPAKLYSFTCAVPEIDHDQVQGELVSLRRQICRQGWLSGVFRDHRELWQQRYAKVAGFGAGEEAGPESDNSTTRRPITVIALTGEEILQPRAQFSADVVRGRHAAEVRAIQVTRLRSSVETSRAGGLVKSVVCDLPGLNGSRPTTYLGSLIEFSPLRGFADYLRPTLPPTPADVDRSIFGLSESVSVDIPDYGPRRERLPLRELDERLVLGAFRLDVSHRVRLDAISVVEGVPFEPRVKETPRPDEPMDDVL